MVSLLQSLLGFSSSQERGTVLIAYPRQRGSIFSARTLEIPATPKLTSSQSKVYDSTEAIVQEKLAQLEKVHPLSSKKRKTNLRGLRASTVNCGDLRHTAKVGSSTLGTRHIFTRNSLFNGCRYQEGEKVKTIQTAITSPHYRSSKEVALLRRVETDDGKGLAYAGRIETREKAEEFIQFLVQKELSGKNEGKGLVRTGDYDEGKPIYEFHFVVSSLISMIRCKLFVGKEPKFVQQEYETLKKLETSKELIKVSVNGREIFVKPKPILFATQFNGLTDIEHILPDELSGKSHAEEIACEGIQKLEKLINDTADTRGKEKNNKIHSAMKALKGNCSAAEKVFLQIYISRLLSLPIDLHCKSSVDRTAIAVGIAAALEQWIQAGKDIPTENPQKILKDEMFKEYFAANVLSGLPISKYARAKNGLKWKSSGIYFPTLTQLLPERLLKTNWRGIFTYLLIWLFSPIITLILTLGKIHYESTQLNKNTVVSIFKNLILFAVYYSWISYVKGMIEGWALINTKKVDETFGGQIPSDISLIY